MHAWRIIQAHEDGREIVVKAIMDSLWRCKDSREAIEKRHEMTSGTSEFIAINDREFICFHTHESNHSVVYVIRRVG